MGFWKSKNIVNFNVFFGSSKIFEFNCETLVIYRWKIIVSVELLFWFKMRNFESLDKQNLFFDKCERLRVIRGLKFKNWRGWRETHDVPGWHFVVVCDVKSPPIIEGYNKQVYKSAKNRLEKPHKKAILFDIINLILSLFCDYSILLFWHGIKIYFRFFDIYFYLSKKKNKNLLHLQHFPLQVTTKILHFLPYNQQNGLNFCIKWKITCKLD